MRNFKKTTTLIAIILIIFIAKSATGIIMDIFNNDFEQRWMELFKEVSKLNEYTTSRAVTLHRANIEGYNIDGAIFSGATFDGVKWEAMSATNSKFTKTVFKNCEFINVNFEDSTLTEVIFDNCKIEYSNFSGCTMLKTSLRNCEIIETRFDGTDGDLLRINSCKIMSRSTFSGSKIHFIFKDTTLSGVNMMGLGGCHPLTIDDCLLDEVDFYKSHFSDITLRRVQQGEGGIKFNGITAESIRLEKAELDGIGFMESHAKTAIIVNSEVFAIGFSGGGVGKITFRNSTVQYFDIAESIMPNVEFTSCNLIEPMLYDGFIKEFVIRDSSIKDITGNGFKADIVVWDNVTLDGKIDFTNAQIKDFRPTRLKRGPCLQLITTGSNVRF
jgi:uncharacterized protein YjbI with pentapeptide repeats